jgi:glycerophosphoryl diester phosphodiesterase
MASVPRCRPALIVAAGCLLLGLSGCGGTDEGAAGPDDGASALPPASTPATTTIPDAPPSVGELLASDVPLVIAHAGGDRDFPHSTLFAYGEAVEAGADVLEMDVQLTGDGVLVVQHDDTVDKTTEATGRVDEMTLDELVALDNAYWFSPECWPCRDLDVDAYTLRGVRTGDREPPEGYEPDDFAVASLRQVAERFPSMPLDIEIKGTGASGIAAAETLADELVGLDRVDSTVVASFDDEVLAAFETAAPDVATSPALGEMAAWVLSGEPLDGNRVVQVPPSFEGVEVVTPELVAQAEAQAIAVWVWPNDGEQEVEAFYRQLFDLGVDGIIAGRPAQAVAARS